MKFILMGLIKRFTKEAGRSPNPVELTNLKKMAQEMESSEKVIPFPMGGKDKISPFKPRPTETETMMKETGIPVTIEGKTTTMTPEDILKKLMGKTETDAEIIARMNKQNKDAVKRLKKKKEKDLGDKLKDFDGDPDAMAMGGRIELSKGGLTKLLKMLQGKMGKKNITTADKIARPESALNREMFGAFEDRMNRKTLNVPEAPSGFKLSKERLLKNYPEIDETFADEIMTMDRDMQIRIIEMLKDRRKNPTAYDKLLMEKGESMDFQGEFDRSVRRSKNAGGGLAYMLGEPREEMTVADKKPEKKFDAEFYKNSIRKDIKDYSEEGMTKRIGPFTFGYMLDSLNRFVEEGGDKDTAKQLQKEIQDFINFHAETFQSLPEDERKEFEEKIKTDFIEDRGIIPGLPYVRSEEAKDGGRIGFSDGGMSRRTFLKIMAALAAFPVVGKLAKTAKVAKGAAPIVTPTAEMPAHFPKLVEKIIREGQVVDRQFVKKTGDIKTYRHPDRADIELTIEGEGDRITLDFETDQGMRGGYEFKKGKPDEMATNPPNEFEAGEVKYKFSPDGESYSKDFEMGIDTGTENLDEFAGMGKQKTSKSKTKLPESLDDDFADGGLAGLLGE